MGAVHSVTMRGLGERGRAAQRGVLRAHAPRAGARALRAGAATAQAVAVEADPSTGLLWVEEFNVGDVGKISANVFEMADSYLVEVTQEGFPASTLLHWSVNDWALPKSEYWPEHTNQVDDLAVQTPFLNNPISISIPKEGAPSKMVFVLKVVDPKECWHNNGSQFTVNVKAPAASDIFDKAIDAEANWSTYTLMQRYTLAMELLGQAEKVPGGDAMGFIYTWLRMSNLKLLDWYRGGNYQSKDMGHVQKTITEMLHNVTRSNDDPLVKHFARLTLHGMQRGGGDSEAIRLEILNIFRKNGIKEGHRPGIEDQFLAGWHQKLHSNTTVEDIAICEAYIHFLSCDGSPDHFWWHLWEYGGISRERMANMKCGWRSNGMGMDPGHFPWMVNDFKHYLWILKTVHAGADLETMVVMSQGHLDDELKGMLWDVVNNRDEWWVGGKALECRQRLEGYWRAGTGGRDVMLLDCVLEKFVRLVVERSDLGSMSAQDLMGQAELLLQNGCIGAESVELGLCLQTWRKMQGQGDNLGEGALAACATVERTQGSLARYMDSLYTRIQPHAVLIGKAAKVDEAYILNFGEESVRGHPLFYLSMVMQHLLPKLRDAAGLSPWQVVSNVEGGAKGQVLVKNLEDIQGESFDVPTVLVSGEIGGLEDIPKGVVAVVCEGSMDVLSHVAIRARNQGVLCVSCADGSLLGDLRALDGSFQQFSVGADGRVVASTATQELGTIDDGKAPAPATVQLEAGVQSDAWCLDDSAFSAAVVGGKGLHCSELRTALAGTAGVAVPASLALPYGSFEKCLATEENKAEKLAVEMLAEELANATTAEERRVYLDTIRAQVVAMVAPDGLEAEVQAAAAAAGLGELPFAAAWEGIKGVWASQWNERAWLSRRAMGLDETSLRMACVLQPVVPAKYAFVLHTANPLTKDPNQILGEVVVGLGETLVSNTPGRAFSFTCAKDGSDIKIVSAPSKCTALYPPAEPTFIARSDSNAEDLDDFAGAGLYDSFILGESSTEGLVNYNDEPLLWDKSFQQGLVTKLAAVAAQIEAAFDGVPQDVEGAMDAEGTVHIVQARPEILL